ncbi:MAG: FlgO family outer membrane protein [bacterium]
MSASLRKCIVISILFLSGCGNLLHLGRTSKQYSDIPVFSAKPVHNYPNLSAGRYKITFIAEQLTKVFKLEDLRDTSVIVLPIHEIGKPKNIISSFGTYFSEQLKTELYLNDFTVLYPGQELEEQLSTYLTGNLDYFMSSQDDPVMNKLVDSGVMAIICGSYQVSTKKIYINVQMILLENSKLISIGTCELKKNKEIMRLITKKRMITRAEAFKSQNEEDHEVLSFTVKGKE